MLNLKKSEYPIASSLFAVINGKPKGTWEEFAKSSIKTHPKMMAKQKEYKSRVFTAMLYNMAEPGDSVNPFTGNPSAAEIVKRLRKTGQPGWDFAELARWQGIIDDIRAGMLFVPTLLCGDDKKTTRNAEFLTWFLPAAVRGAYPHSAAINVISESSKSWSVAEQKLAVAACKAAFDMEPKLKPIPILVHNSSANIASNADGWMMEFSFDPWSAGQHSASDVVAELKKALRDYPGQIWVQELAVLCEQPWAREMVRAIRKLAETERRIVGLPGPA
jgi:hypothetical protein